MLTTTERRQGGVYLVTGEEKERFLRDGFVHLEGVLSEDEVAAVEADYDRFLRQEISVAGKDYCDMAGDYGRPVEEYSIVNVMLPRKYYEPWQGNVYEQRAASIAAQLCGPEMIVDYDQLLAKRPFKEDAVFAWHQDMAYWIDTPDTRTATCWLAVDDSTVDNGCMRFVPGSHLEPDLRPHRPLHEDRSISHTLMTDLRDDDAVLPMPIKRGDITVHNERVLHGSGGNSTAGWRRAYIVAFRSMSTVELERARGFTHSHNDGLEVLDSVTGV
jgi:ectoine hydroxylase-related dioxygenase (phytanoyl-CoA dioxygenase family)